MAIPYVHVLATTDEGTRSALKAARRIASERGVGVVLLVPRVVTFALTLDQPGESPAAIAESYRAMADTAGVDARVRVCFCRERHHVFGRMLIEHAEVIVGGRRRQWWPTVEERLARRLSGEGHQVSFAEVDPTPNVRLAARESARV